MEKTVVEMDFAELPDGTLVEMIEDPANPAAFLLAVYQRGSVHYAAEWRDGNRILVPLSQADQRYSMCISRKARSRGTTIQLEFQRMSYRGLLAFWRSASMLTLKRCFSWALL